MGKLGTSAIKWSLLTLALAVLGTTMPVFSSAAEQSGGTESGWEAVGSNARRGNIRTAELFSLPLEENGAIRPVAHQQDLWAPEEPANGKLTTQELTTPESVLPSSVPQTAPQSAVPDFSLGTQELSTEQVEEIPAPVTSSVPFVPTAPSSSSEPPTMPYAPKEGSEGNVTPTAPPRAIPESAQKGLPKGTAPHTNKLAKSESKIDRNGNFGSIGNFSAMRTEEGVLLGNPYANGIHEYHPRCFNVDPNSQVRLRNAPPVSSYGEDGYGNPALYTCGDGSCGGCGGCGVCSECLGGECGTECGAACAPYGWCGCGIFQGLYYALRNAEAELGVFAFQDPFGIGSDNSFGVDIGLNWSAPQRLLLGLNTQAGGRFTQTGKEEYFVDGVEDSSRSQFFWTAGLFYRNPTDSWQFGAVYDLLRDESCWTYTLGQVRTELSRRCSETTDIGFRGAFALDDELINFWNDDDRFQSEISVNSYYTGFLRHTFVTGAEGMLFGGVTEESEGLVGGHLEVPVTNHSSLRNSFVYIFPKSNENRYLDNSWSVNLTWVVYFGGNSREGMINPLRPLFEVADNTSLLQRAKVK